jgi:hypothetical protein
MMMSATIMETTPAGEQRALEPGRADVSAISFQNVSKYFLANDNSRLEFCAMSAAASGMARSSPSRVHPAPRAASVIG